MDRELKKPFPSSSSSLTNLRVSCQGGGVEAASVIGHANPEQTQREQLTAECMYRKHWRREAQNCVSRQAGSSIFNWFGLGLTAAEFIVFFRAWVDLWCRNASGKWATSSCWTVPPLFSGGASYHSGRCRAPLPWPDVLAQHVPTQPKLRARTRTEIWEQWFLL